ncbi:MAG TPA: DNA topoisomerase IB [Candidatus Nanoarchaeia archaeon]|nr:DNA topoisomerase IB [Candidatus Nanoarchaeia archaeon]
MAKQLFYRQGTAEAFYYVDNQGNHVSDVDALNQIKGLVIPPAWVRVEINLSPRAKVRATGIDDAGRKQYIYDPKFREKQERAKFDRILAFANALPMMRRVTGEHLKQPELNRQKVLACMVRLIDLAYFRVGSERYAEENHTYGIATMRSRHLTIDGDKMIFHYIGKRDKEHVQEVEDSQLAKIVRELDHLPGYEIFKYYDETGQLIDVKSQDLNDYIKEVMGYDFSAKDFRTWAGTLIAAVALAEVDKAKSQTAAKRNVAAAVRHVSEHLGNTPAIARASYIDPRIIDFYLSGQTIRSYLKQVDKYLLSPESDHFSQAEVAVLKLLKRQLRHKVGQD